jgi:hypothetical protein
LAKIAALAGGRIIFSNADAAASAPDPGDEKKTENGV